jgi:hypothetical protein
MLTIRMRYADWDRACETITHNPERLVITWRSFIKLKFIKTFCSPCRTLTDQITHNPRYHCICIQHLNGPHVVRVLCAIMGPLHRHNSNYGGKTGHIAGGDAIYKQIRGPTICRPITIENNNRVQRVLKFWWRMSGGVINQLCRSIRRHVISLCSCFNR